MAQSESQRPEFEEDDASDLNDDAASIEGSGSEEVDSLQNDVDGILDSINNEDSEWETLDELSYSEEGDSSRNDEASEASVKSDSDDLLLRAGSILNGGETEIPDIEPEPDPESAPDKVADSEGLMSMPDPQSLMDSEGTVENDSSDKEPEKGADLSVTPAPQSALEKAEATNGGVDTEEPDSDGDQDKRQAPPPPAPVTLEEDEIIRELGVEEEDDLPAASVAEEESEGSSSADSAPEEIADFKPEEAVPDTSEAVPEEEVASKANPGESKSETSEEDDGFEIDGGESFLMDDEDEDLGLLTESEPEEIEIPQASAPGQLDSSGPTSETAKEETTGIPSRIKSVIGSLGSWPIAASIAVFGVGILMASFKDEVIEWLTHGDIEGSSISHRVAAITEQVINEIGHESPFRTVWLESDIKRVSDSELRIYSKVGVELEMDLYQPADDSIVYAKLPFDREALKESARMLAEIGRQDIELPRKRWDRLYKHSASKGEVYPFSLSYRLLKSDTSSEWELSALRLKEGEQGFAWAHGRPKSYYGKQAFDVGSNEFVSLFRAYEREGMAFLNRTAAAEKAHVAMLDGKARKLEQARKDLLMAMSQGSYFKGMLIAGEEGSEAREVSMIITETRNNGQLIKGVLKLENDGMSSKHFTAFFDVFESEEEVRGRLDLTTIAFAGQNLDREVSPFFNSGTVSKIELQTDGLRLEGDAGDISLRLTRSL